MLFGYTVLDRFGWPLERVYSSKSKFRTFLGWINYFIRCIIHGRKIVKNWKEPVVPLDINCCCKESKD